MNKSRWTKFKEKERGSITEWQDTTSSRLLTLWANLIYDFTFFSDILPFFSTSFKISGSYLLSKYTVSTFSSALFEKENIFSNYS